MLEIIKTKIEEYITLMQKYGVIITKYDTLHISCKTLNETATLCTFYDTDGVSWEWIFIIEGNKCHITCNTVDFIKTQMYLGNIKKEELNSLERVI